MKNLLLLILSSLILYSCSSSVDKFRPTVFYPESKTGILSYYSNGIPFGAFNIDSSTNCIISVEEVKILENKYFRLWLLYQNNSDENYLLEPLKIVKMGIKGNNGKYYELKPEPPSSILVSIDDEKESKLIVETIGSTLKMISNNVSTKNTTITDNRNHQLEVNDKGEKIEARNEKIVSNAKSNFNDITTWYDTYLTSINNGILRKNTLFKNQSVNGYIYFLLPDEFQSKKFDRFDVRSYPDPDDKKNFDIEKSLFTLIIKTNTGEKVVEYKISKDE